MAQVGPGCPQHCAIPTSQGPCLATWQKVVQSSRFQATCPRRASGNSNKGPWISCPQLHTYQPAPRAW
eukprot:15217387-Alexandrium_andersonii.AAC.1